MGSLTRAVAAVVATTAMLTPVAPASADYNDRDGGLVSFGDGYAEPVRYIDAYNAWAGRQAVAIGATEGHACAVDTAGQAVCWGEAGYGSGGSGDAKDEYGERKPAALVQLDAVGSPRLTSVDAGDKHTCALSRAGNTYCWGSDDEGQLGNGSAAGTAYVPEPVVVSHLAADLRFTEISTGAAHTCALDDRGRAYCWGDGSTGQLGTGDVESALRPRRVLDGDAAGRSLVSIDAGAAHTCATDQAGRLYCWGTGDVGQLGLGDTRGRLQPRLVPGTGPGAHVIVTVSAGPTHTCAVTATNQVLCWGDNDKHRVNGSRTDRFLTPTVVDGVSATDVSAGVFHTCAIDTDGAALCWGKDNSGQIGDGQRRGVARYPTAVLTDGVLAGRQLVEIQAGRYFTAAMDRDGVLYKWSGDPRRVTQTFGKLAGADLTSVEANGFDLCVTDPSRVMCVEHRLAPFHEIDTSQLSEPLDLITLTVGDDATCLLSLSGQAYCRGWNHDGALGIGETAPWRYFARPKRVATDGVLSGVTLRQISTGGSHTCAVSTAGAAYCWGSNRAISTGHQGMIGDGTMSDTYLPVAVDVSGALAGVVLTSISAGQDHTCAVSVNGRLFCWGHQPDGDYLSPVEVDLSALAPGERVASVVADTSHTCLLTDAGHAFCWGANDQGQVGAGVAGKVATPTAVDTSGVLSGVRLTALASTRWGGTVCALSAAGRVFCWGDGSWGALGNGGYRDSDVPVRVERTGPLANRRVTDLAGTTYGFFVTTVPS